MLHALVRLLGVAITVALLALPRATPAAAVATPATPAAPVVVAARVTTTPERGRLILDLSAPTTFAIVSLADPDRIAVDVKADSLRFDAPPPPAGAGLVTAYGVEMAEPGRARAMLTLAGPAQVQQAYVLDAFADQPARLVVDLVPDTPEKFAERVATDARALAAAAPAADAAAPQSPAPATPAPAAGTPAIASLPPAIGGDIASPPPAGAKARPLIVLDPGHGGNDSGARVDGVMEKDVVLAFALKLQALLVKSGRFDVALTRADDSYLTLEQRVALARANKADLFISLHADSFGQPQIHGASIYTRDEQATDVLDKVLADNENRSDIIAGYVAPKAPPAVVDVLLDLMRRQMRKQAYRAADAIIGQLEPNVQLRRFPVRQADFFVLQAPDVPSMLIELGFMSNSDDMSNLTKPDWQDRVAAALARGIASYFDELADP